MVTSQGERWSPRRALSFWGIGALVVGGLYVAGLLVHLWLLAFATILLALLLDGLSRPLRTWLRLRRSLAVLTVAILLVGALVGLVLVLGPRISDQITQLQQRLPRALETVRSWVSEHEWLTRWFTRDGEATSWGGVFDVSRRLTQFLSTLLGAVTVAVVIVFAGLYLAINPDPYQGGAVRLVPPDHRDRARSLLLVVATGLRRWLVGRLAAMVAVAVLTSLGLWILGVPLALTLGLIAGLLTFVPFVGPILSAVPAGLLALLQGLQMVLWVAILYIVVQLIENNIVTPAVQRKAVSLPPAVLLLAQIAAALLVGPVGVVLATPIAVAVILAVQILYLRDAMGDDVPLLTDRHRHGT